MNSSTATFRYHGTGGALFGLAFVNGLLTIVTLGIYSFWAKNKVREFHYSHTEMDGDRFAYHGTGGELFAGAVKAVAVLLLLSIAFAGLMIVTDGPEASPVVQVGTTAALYLVVGLLVIVAINGARR